MIRVICALEDSEHPGYNRRGASRGRVLAIGGRRLAIASGTAGSRAVRARNHKLLSWRGNCSQPERMRRAASLAEQLAERAGDLPGLLEILLPGTSEAVVRLRGRALEFLQDPLARTALLCGPVGSGKSTMARVIALLRYIGALPGEAQRGVLKAVRFDGPVRIDKHYLQWYEEIALTGLKEETAETQLFGVVKGAFTGASETRMGVFEAAAKGHDPAGPAGAGAKITGGVVLLDEIGDLPAALQPKLLLVVTGAEVFKFGGEGHRHHGFRYNGITIAATWRNQSGLLRPDLLSRFSDHEILMPSLEERVEDFPVLVEHMVEDLNRVVAEEVKRLSEITPMDRARLQALESRRLAVAEPDMKTLARHQWSRYGELRGLRQVLQRMFQGVGVVEALERQSAISTEEADADLDRVAHLILALLEPLPTSSSDDSPGFAEHVKEVERRVRSVISDKLLKDRTALARIARRIVMDPARLRDQLADFRRVRRSERGGAGDRT